MINTNFDPELPSMFRNKRRNKMEIKVDILKSVRYGFAKPTKIMYATNTSWKMVQDHLNDLVGRKLLDETHYGKKRIYSITENGLDFLALVQQVNEFGLE